MKHSVFTEPARLFRGLMLIVACCVSAQAADVTWTGGTGGGTAWLTAGNWDVGVPGATDVAQFGAAGTAVTIGINMNGTVNNGANNQAVGTITLLPTASINRTINNSSTVAAGTLTLNGVGGVLLSNASTAQTLTIANGSSQSMGLALATSGDIHVNSGAAITISSSISDVGGSHGFTKVGGGTLTLSGVNTYSGGTTNLAGTINFNATATFGDGTGPLVWNGGTWGLTATRNTTTGVIENPIVMLGDTVIQNTTTAAAGTRNLPFGTDSIETVGGTLTIRNIASANANIMNVRFQGAGFDFTRPIVFDNSLAGDSSQNLVQLDAYSLANTPAQVFSGVISGNGQVRRGALSGGNSGSTILTAQNTYTGGTLLEDGELGLGSSSVGPAGAPASGPIGTGTLQIANSTAATRDPRISASGGPRVVGNSVAFTSGSTAPKLTFVGEHNLELSGPIDLGSISRTLQVDSSGQTRLSGQISGDSVGFTKTGSGLLELTGNNVYTGDTVVEAGTLLVNNQTGSGTGAGNVTVNGGTFGGSGNISGSVTLNAGATISAGDSPGNFSTGSQIWNGGAANRFEINLALGAAGADPGWDLLNITGSLTINADASDRFAIHLVSLTPGNTAGDVSDFDFTVNYSWLMASATDGVFGFDADAFLFVTTEFSNDLGGGTFDVVLLSDGKDLVVTFTPVPEPGAATLLILGAMLLGRFAARKQNR